MLIPSSRLLWWVGAVVLPFAAAAALAPSAAGVAWAAIALLAMLVLADGVRSLDCLDGLSIELAPVVRLAKDRQGIISLQIKNESQRGRQLRLGLLLSQEFSSAHEDMLLMLRAGYLWSRLDWACTPRKRGRFKLEKCCLEGVSPLGFWAVRRAAPVQTEIRVYPDLKSERKQVAALFLKRGLYGAFAQRQVGKGREFEKLRDYIPGDSFDEIHWKATAKHGHPVTKVFQVERTQEVYLVLDASRLSARSADTPGLRLKVQGSRFKESDSAWSEPGRIDQALETGTSNLKPNVLERFITAALVMGMAAERQGDLFGLITFSDRVHQFVRARNGKAHYSLCRDSLYTLQPQIVTPDYDEVCAFIRVHLRRRVLLVFLTDLDDPVLAESFVRNMDLLRQHLILVNMMQPAGAQPLFSDVAVAALDDLYQRLGGHIRWQWLRELDKVLQRRGVRFSLLSDEKLCAQLVTQYLTVKQRQLL
jgi:uncharacterized protein (DUF58 family)